jgi:NAD(P)-dependent dehydrogenase (short-subunit alcohol dehydrogenase family)
MRVFVAGASGAIGTRLVPQLIDRGHEAIGTFRSPGHGERVRAHGAQPIALDLLDPGAVRKAVLRNRAPGNHSPGDRAGRPERLQSLRPQAGEGASGPPTSRPR